MAWLIVPTGDRLIDFEVFPTLQTSRLVLREIVTADAADLFAFRSDPEEQKYNDPPLRHPTDAQELIARWPMSTARGARSIGG